MLFHYHWKFLDLLYQLLYYYTTCQIYFIVVCRLPVARFTPNYYSVYLQCSESILLGFFNAAEVASSIIHHPKPLQTHQISFISSCNCCHYVCFSPTNLLFSLFNPNILLYTNDYYTTTYSTWWI